MRQEEINKYKPIDEDFFNMVEQLMKCKPGKEQKHYYELVMLYAGDSLLGSVGLAFCVILKEGLANSRLTSMGGCF